MKKKTDQHDQHEADLQRLRLLGNSDYQRLTRLSEQIQQQLDAGAISLDVANEAQRAVAGETLAVIAETSPELYRAARADGSWEMWNDYASGADQDTGDGPDAKEARRKQCLELVEAVEAHRAAQAGEITDIEYTNRIRPAFPDVVAEAEHEVYAGWTPDAEAGPVELDSPQMQAYVARKEAEAERERIDHPNSVIPDNQVVGQPGPTEFWNQP